MQQHMQDIREANTGSIRMGESHYINAYILPQVLAGFSKEYYKLDSDLTNRMFYMLLPKRKYASHAVRMFVDYCSHSL